MTRSRCRIAAGLLAALAAGGPALAAHAAPDGLVMEGGTLDPAQVRAGTYQLDPHHGRIAWSIGHMGLSVYTGLIANVNATLVLDPHDLSRTTLDATADMSSIGTLYPAMDKNLQGSHYFDVARFPTAHFVSSRIRRTGPTTADITGMLTMHGVTRELVLHAVFNQAGPNPIQKVYNVGFEAHATIRRFDYGLDTDPRFIGADILLDLEGEFRLTP